MLRRMLAMHGPIGYAARIALVAILYIATGKLGLLLAVPPGYATVIWPPSGIAVGILIIHGRRLWPGIFIGSLLLNVYIAHAYSPDNGFDWIKLGIATTIAAGSTLQALAARALVARYIGLPLILNQVREVFRLLMLAAPIACLIAATIGVGVLFLSGAVTPENLVGNWLAWWAGDVFGILIFLPLMLVAPGNSNRLVWRGTSVSSLPTLLMLALIVPLGLTFYAWKITSETDYRQSAREFEALANENEKALLHRLNSYENALLGGTGFIQGSEHVSKEEWHKYVEALQLKKNFPGMNGLGWVQPVAPQETEAYLKQVRSDGAPDFAIHPHTEGKPLYVITFVEPEALNRQAIGLNIAFESHREEAALLARDSGKAAITKRIVLVQDNERTPGFLLLYPLYATDHPIVTPGDRQKALRGWVYAPFIAKNFLSGLTHSQGYKLALRIYDGDKESPDALIYASQAPQSGKPAFTIRKSVELLQQRWLVVWESTPAYEREESSDNPLMMLIAGLMFTGLLGLFLLVVTVRRTETMERIAGERRFIVPLLIFTLVAAGSAILYQTLEQRELDYIRYQSLDDATYLIQNLKTQSRAKLDALQRIAQRWEKAGGTPEDLWRSDVQNYLAQLDGLKAVEWIDATNHIRWVEPIQGNENVLGIDVAYDSTRAALLADAVKNGSPTITPPLKLQQGYEAFIMYLPLHVGQRADGFMAGLFSLEALFRHSLSAKMNENYAITLRYNGKDYFSNGNEKNAADVQWVIRQPWLLQDRQWELRMVPTRVLIESNRSQIPRIILAGGLLIALLAALTVRYILISRLRLQRLRLSNQLNSAILSGAAYIMIATDENGRIMTFNQAAEKALGYRAADIIGKETPALWHDMQEVVERAWTLSEELGQRVEPGFEVFTAKARRDGVESREWTFVRRDGSRFPVNLTVTLLGSSEGGITGYLGIAEDITERKRAEQALKISEEKFRTAMDSAPIGKALVDLDGRWLKVNPALCELLGYSEEELLANDFQSITHPDDLGIDIDLIEQLRNGKIKRYQLEKRYYHKSGRIIWVQLTVSLARHADGAPHYFIAQIQDISERREIERMKSEFISTVSHELRTPLTSIRGSLGLILGAMAEGLPENIKSLLKIAHSNCERLILLINDILDMDKLASGEMRYQMRQESVAEITAQAVEANQSYAERFGVRFALAPVPDTLRIRVDPARYIQVLSNLLSNAAKFSPSGSVVDVTVKAIKGKVRVEVSDKGPGIPEEFHGRVFDKFSQADSSASRSKGGTGLGLHITRQMVEHMGGKIDFSTTLGKGTTFWVEFAQVNG